MKIGDAIQAVVEKLIFSGKGLLRKDGWIIFVDGVIEGETVEVELTEKKKNYFVGVLKRVLTPSSHRIQAPCPVYGVCGGCALQHMQYQQGLKEKAAWLQESLQRIAKISLQEKPTVLPADPIYGYRRKIKLHFRRERDTIILGFFAKDNTTLLNLNSCPIFIEKETDLFDQVRLKLLQSNLQEGEVVLCKIDDTAILMQFEEAVHVFGSNNTDNLSMHIDDLTIFFTPNVFMQNHPKVSLQLYRDVVEKIERLCPKKPMFDLYSGIGILSQLIAKQGHEVDAIEGNPEAIQMAKKSAAFNKIDSVQFYAASVEQFLHRTKKDVPLWIVNPPRTGLSPDVVEQIQKKGPEYLIYISCNPTTLSRDLAQLSRFEIASIQGYDMFPQTTHFETVVFAKKIRR